MIFTILAAGSRGDVQPYLALAVGLKEAGYQVRLAANCNFNALASAYGLDFYPLNIDSQALVQSRPAQAWLSSSNFLKLALNTTRVVQPTLAQLLKDAWAACQGSDVIIYHSFTFPTAHYIGQALKIPCLPASLYPQPTRAHPALPLNIKSLGQRLNLVSHLALQLFGWQLYRASARNFFGPKLKIAFTGPYRQLGQEKRPILCSYSALVVPPPTDLSANVHITGYWFLDAPPAWKPRPALIDFLQSGPPPIFAGFASMGDPALADTTTRIVVDALAQTGQRGMLVSGWSGLGSGMSLPDNIFVLKQAPYQWLLPQMAVIIHHGGAGTTGASLAAGVPNVVIPHFSDNYFWARRVDALGYGPKPIPRKNLSSEQLAQAISQALHDRLFHTQSAKIGRQIRTENGVGRAIEVVNQYLSSYSA